MMIMNILSVSLIRTHLGSHRQIEHVRLGGIDLVEDVQSFCYHLVVFVLGQVLAR